MPGLFILDTKSVHWSLKGIFSKSAGFIYSKRLSMARPLQKLKGIAPRFHSPDSLM